MERSQEVHEIPDGHVDRLGNMLEQFYCKINIRREKMDEITGALIVDYVQFSLSDHELVRN